MGNRHKLSKGKMLHSAKARVVGHLNYYAITDNSRVCNRYVYQAMRILYKWLNRKSQRRAYTWDGFTQVLGEIGWPPASIHKVLNPFRRRRFSE